jgi:hypothetical protein
LELIGTRSPGCTYKAALFREGLFALELEDYVNASMFGLPGREQPERVAAAPWRPVSKSSDEANEPKNMNGVLHDPA